MRIKDENIKTFKELKPGEVFFTFISNQEVCHLNAFMKVEEDGKALGFHCYSLVDFKEREKVYPRKAYLTLLEN